MSDDHFDALDAARDLEAAGIVRPHAEAIARAVGRAVAPLATRADVQRLETTLQGDMDQRFERHEARTRMELANLRTDMYRALWIQGAGIVAVVAAPNLLP